MNHEALLQERLDQLCAENAALQAKLDAALDPAALAERVNARVSLVAKTRSLLGDCVNLDAKSDREIMIDVIRLDVADFDGTGESNDYICGRFEAIESATVRNDSVDAIVRNIENARRADGSLDLGSLDPVTRAQIEAYERAARGTP